MVQKNPTLFRQVCLSVLFGKLLRIIDPGIPLDQVHVILPHGFVISVPSESASGIQVYSCRPREVVPAVLLLLGLLSCSIHQL